MIINKVQYILSINKFENVKQKILNRYKNCLVIVEQIIKKKRNKWTNKNNYRPKIIFQNKKCLRLLVFPG